MTDCDVKQVPLAVQKANYVVKMYEQVGFRTVDENGQEYIMVVVCPVFVEALEYGN